MTLRVIIAYSLIVLLVAAAVAAVSWLMYNTRTRKLRRYYRKRDAELASEPKSAERR